MWPDVFHLTMAKYPAFLFYTGDFSTGTQFMTHEQVGKYIRLMMAQHQHGHLSAKQVTHICGAIDPDVMEKFEKDYDGKYFNARLDAEIVKRKKHSENQKNNIKKGWNIPSDDLVYTKPIPNEYQNDTMVIPLENENENENRNENDIVIEKVKEKKIEIASAVLMTESEKEKVQDKFGSGYLWAIETLSNYKQSSGKKYKSDYHAIIGWVFDKYIKEKNNHGQQQTNGAIRTDNKFAKEYFERRAHPIDDGIGG